jgi:pimeloyl-ACP methyl ester carboxylesterase
MPLLARAGYRAVAPTMRGYEPSSIPPDGDLHVLRLAEDVEAFVDELGAGPVHLVGHDWGAVVAHLVAARSPERLRSLTTLAVPHPGRLEREVLAKRPSQLRKSWYMGFFQLRGIADHWLERRDFAFVERLWRDWSPGWELPPEELAAVKDTLRRPGVKRAALGYYRALAAPWSTSSRVVREALSRPIRVPTLALTGALDGCMDTRLYDDLMRDEDFPAGLRVVRFDGVGHFLHQEAPERVGEVILEHLRRVDARPSER